MRLSKEEPASSEFSSSVRATVLNGTTGATVAVRAVGSTEQWLKAACSRTILTSAADAFYIILIDIQEHYYLFIYVNCVLDRALQLL